MNPPLDGNSLVISTLDRVRDHPFVSHAAWDLVVIDECLSVQNVDAKRCESGRAARTECQGVVIRSIGTARADARREPGARRGLSP
eukprot:443545-Prymnesium_polylepis.1